MVDYIIYCLKTVLQYFEYVIGFHVVVSAAFHGGMGYGGQHILSGAYFTQGGGYAQFLYLFLLVFLMEKIKNDN